MVLHRNRAIIRRAKKKVGNNFLHTHYHPNTRNPEKRITKPISGIPQISTKCARCSKAFSRTVDSMEHFSEVVVKNGWKRVDFIKSGENENTYAKDIHGICCPECQKDIMRWEEENRPHHKEAAKTTKLMTMLAVGAELINQAEEGMKAFIEKESVNEKDAQVPITSVTLPELPPISPSDPVAS